MTWDIYFTGLHVPEHIDSNGVDIRVHHTATIKISFTLPKNIHQLNSYLQKEPIIIFLSKTSVKGFHFVLDEQGISIDNYSFDFLAVGEETSKAIEENFHQHARIPEFQNATGLIKILRTIPKKPVILITAEETRLYLPNWLDDEGWDYCHLKVYSTMIKQNYRLQEIFKNTQNEIIIFTSPSTVLGFLKSVDMTDLKSITSRLLSIGPTTTRSIEQHLGTVFLESSQPNLSVLTNELLPELSAGSITSGMME